MTTKLINKSLTSKSIPNYPTMQIKQTIILSKKVANKKNIV